MDEKAILGKRLSDALDEVAAAKRRLMVAEDNLQYVQSLIHRLKPEEAK